MSPAVVILAMICVVLACGWLAEAQQTKRLRKLIAPFDHDHDGRPGG